MKKEISLHFFIFLFAGMAIMIVGAFMILYFSPFKPAGLVVLSDYDNETSCVGAGYNWTDLTEENCTTTTICINETIDCEPCTDYEEINNTQGDCIEWSECTNQTCVSEETCVDVVIGGQCTGDICDSNHLSLCLNETDCTNASGYWYNDECNIVVEPSCSNDLDLCLDETNCTEEGGYWYNDECNSNECSSDSHCDSGYECNSGNCEEIVEESTDSESTTTETAQVVNEAVTTTTPAVITPVEPEYGLVLEGGTWDLSLKPFEPWEITTYAKNTGNTQLSSCVLNPHEYISFSEKSVDIAVDAQEPFTFIVKAPEISGTQNYNIPIKIDCTEKSVSKTLNLEVVKKSFEFNLIDLRKIRKNKIRAIYTLEDFVNLNHTINIDFSLYDNQNIKIAEASDVNNLSSNSTEEFNMILIVNETRDKTIEGNMSIQADIVSDIYSIHFEEEVIPTTSWMAGFAVFSGDNVKTNAAVFTMAILAIALVIFTIRRFRNNGEIWKIKRWIKSKGK